MFGLLAQGLLTFGGIGLSLYGTQQQVKLAKEKAGEEQAIAMDEQRAEAVRYTAMVYDARRRQLETIRNAQRARAMAVSAAVNQGVGVGSTDYGSGLPGGEGQIAADAATSQKNISVNQQFGQQMFAVNSDIAGHKWKEAQISGDMAEAQGWSSLGGSLVSAAPAFGRIIGAFS